jgi:hypothetical protein
MYKDAKTLFIFIILDLDRINKITWIYGIFILDPIDTSISSLRNFMPGLREIFWFPQKIPFDNCTIPCYYILVISNTSYKSYRIVRRDYAGKPYGNAERCAGGLCP